MKCKTTHNRVFHVSTRCPRPHDTGNIMDQGRMDTANETVSSVESSSNGGTSPRNENMNLFTDDNIDVNRVRYPHCIVWTPIPCLTWLFPIIGHMGIATSSGVIRDFAGPYYVSEDNMAFGNPTKYWQLPLERVPGVNQRETWDRAIYDASEEYKGRMHNLFCDNCHSHVALALNLMKYDNSTSWNMVNVTLTICCKAQFVGPGGFLKTWLPFMVVCVVVVIAISVIHA